MRQAFRLGILVDEVSGNLQSRDLTDTGTPDPWAYVLPGVAADEVQKELNAIHTQLVSLMNPDHFISNLINRPENP